MIAILTRNLSRAVTDLKTDYQAKFISQRQGSIYAATQKGEFLICLEPRDLHGQKIADYIVLSHCSTSRDWRVLDEMREIADILKARYGRS